MKTVYMELLGTADHLWDLRTPHPFSVGNPPPPKKKKVVRGGNGDQTI
jgi:hypothetical protein